VLKGIFKDKMLSFFPNVSAFKKIQADIFAVVAHGCCKSQEEYLFYKSYQLGAKHHDSGLVRFRDSINKKANNIIYAWVEFLYDVKLKENYKGKKVKISDVYVKF
jgi:hypothetical protein